MIRRYRGFVVVGLIGMLFFAGLQLASAQQLSSINSITITGLTYADNGICGTRPNAQPQEAPFLYATANVTPAPGFVTHPGAFIEADIYDAIGNHIGHSTPSLANIGTQPADISVGVQLNQSPSVRPWRLVLTDSSEVLGSMIFDPADYDSGCNVLPNYGTVIIVDSTIGGDIAVYATIDDEGNPALDVYGINSEGEGYYLFSITEELLAPYIDNPPSENTELESVGDVTLYILTTGEYQLNIGPDEEGKVRVIIFEGLPPTNIYSYDFNVYDILYPEQ